MSPVDTKTRCTQGHLFTEKNTYLAPPHRKNGKRYKQCRICHSETNKRRYATDPAFRAAQIARALKFYHANIRLRQEASPD